MAERMNGRYKLVCQENLDHCLAALGIDETKRKMMVDMKQDREFVVKGKHVTMKTISPLVTHAIEFNLGEEFEEDLSNIDGSICKTTVTWDGNKLVGVQKSDVPNRTWKQWVEGDKLYAEITVKDKVCKQTFQRV